MTNKGMLKEKINNSGLKIGYIATKIGITRAGFYKKISNQTEFKASEIEKLCKLLELSKNEKNEIFFA